jgi:branched-chain amino acid transport system permease protein
MRIGLTSRRVAVGVIWVVVTSLLAALPVLGLQAYGMRQIVLVAMFSLIVSGLNLSYGYAGELALGQAAVYAAGAYVTAYVAANLINDILLTMALAAGIALLIGVVTGIPGLRLGGWLLAMASFFLVLLVPPILNIFGDQLGGFEGFTGIPVPQLFGRELDSGDFYVFVIIVASLWFAVFRNLVTSVHGNAFRVLRTSPLLAESLGVPRYSMKLKAYAIGAVPAGIAGTLAAYLDGFIAPESFGLDLAIGVLAACILGGSASVYGPVFGSAIIVLAPLRVTAFDQYALVAYGVLLVVGGVLLSKGLAGLFRQLLAKTGVLRLIGGGGAPEVAERALRPIEGRRLVVSGLSKRFGGNQALQDVSFTAEPGEVTALIGPNGSGKTTVLNLVSGFYRVDEGSITVGDTETTSLSPPRVSRAGVGRTFQTPLVPEDMSVRDVVVTGMFADEAPSMAAAIVRTPGYLRAGRQMRARADRILSDLELLVHADEDAASLALGTRRVLELARVLAGEKSVVLLDEVASGLDEHEIGELASVVRQLRDAGATVVLVEHNFSLVKQISDRVVVLADGRVIADGPPKEVEANPDVARLYLGEGAAITGTRAVPASVEVRSAP